MWGQVFYALVVSFFCRIIPTRVGTRLRKAFSRTLQWDHPHACGDKRSCDEILSRLLGSSPRVWGQVISFVLIVSAIGIIPTRVGTSTLDNSINSISEDHPHACGDKYRHSLFSPVFLGSSPRVWGQGVRYTELC